MSVASIQLPEGSFRYRGWRVVFACFVMAIFAWSLGLYANGVYLVELQRLRGWSASQISLATTGYYLVSAVLIIFTSDFSRMLGCRAFVCLGAACTAAATASLGFVSQLWQLYVAYGLLAIGWASMSMAGISGLIEPWFVERRGFAISLAMNGAGVAGIVTAPAFVAGITFAGFPNSVLIAASLVAVVLIPVLVAFVRLPGPPHATDWPATSEPMPAKSSGVRRRALQSLRFWTAAGPYALSLLAQVGFLVHHFAFAAERFDRTVAAAAVSIVCASGIMGRMTLGVVVDRLEPRLTTAACLVVQSIALGVMISWTTETGMYVSAALFGLSIGNVTILPILIIQREFDRAIFAQLVSLAVAIAQFTFAFGPGLVGILKDRTGGYVVPLLCCAVFQLVAALVVASGRERPAARLNHVLSENEF